MKKLKRPGVAFFNASCNEQGFCHKPCKKVGAYPSCKKVGAYPSCRFRKNRKNDAKH